MKGKKVSHISNTTADPVSSGRLERSRLRTVTKKKWNRKYLHTIDWGVSARIFLFS